MAVLRKGRFRRNLRLKSKKVDKTKRDRLFRGIFIDVRREYKRLKARFLQSQIIERSE